MNRFSMLPLGDAVSLPNWARGKSIENRFYNLH